MGSIPRIWRNQRQRYTLAGEVCRRCGHLSLSPHAVCPQCHPAVVEADLWLPEMGTAGEPVPYAVLLPANVWREEICVPAPLRQTPDKGREP